MTEPSYHYWICVNHPCGAVVRGQDITTTKRSGICPTCFTRQDLVIPRPVSPLLAGPGYDRRQEAMRETYQREATEE